MTEIKIIKYKSELKNQWNQFVSNSKNGTFIFYRDYMEYHSDRFMDYSLTILKNDKLIGLLPANIDGKVLYSHGGLTFGGIISDINVKANIMLDIFDQLIEFLKNEGIKKLIYKVIPHIYHKIPAEEDLFALFIHGANLIRRDLSSTINLREKIVYNKGRKWSIKKSKSYGLEVKRSYDFKNFMKIEKEILNKKYNVEPTHTAEELELLSSRFPENIKLFSVYKDSKMIAGAIIYESKNVAHTQYLGSTDEGKEIFAQDFLLDYLIRIYYKNKKYFDFGISTEQNGRYLNLGLIQYKEGFGAFGIRYDFYELDIS